MDFLYVYKTTKISHNIRPNCSTVYYSNMCGNRTFMHRRLDFCHVEYNVKIYINCPSQRAGTILVRFECGMKSSGGTSVVVAI
jgi:hypothetical protein